MTTPVVPAVPSPPNTATPPNPHAVPGAAAGFGTLAGVALMVVAGFHAHSWQSGMDSATTFSGAGLSLGSILGFIAHYTGIKQAQIAAWETRLRGDEPRILSAAAAVEAIDPAIGARVDALEAGIDDRVRAAVSTLPPSAQVDVEDLAERVRSLIVAGWAGPAAPAVVPPAG